MSGEGKHTHTHTHFFQRISKTNETFSQKTWKKICQFYLRTQKFLLKKSSVYKFMNIHKVIHLLGTYSHLEAAKKLQL